eukprot:GDKK01008563.1.p1 GENE.GDKK01008563.1~~GDKK01008563.1.p1  ORF type:complete len:100 (+),score=1.67 GDKK01008563.1:1-300(+)
MGVAPQFAEKSQGEVETPEYVPESLKTAGLNSDGKATVPARAALHYTHRNTRHRFDRIVYVKSEFSHTIRKRRDKYTPDDCDDDSNDSVDSSYYEDNYW